MKHEMKHGSCSVLVKLGKYISVLLFFSLMPGCVVNEIDEFNFPLSPDPSLVNER